MYSLGLNKLSGARKREIVFLGVACAVSILYRGWDELSAIVFGIPATSHISYDGVYYAQIARNILAGAGFGWEAMIFPVLQPLLVAGASLATGVDNLVFLAKCVNLVAGALALVPVYYLARELFGAKAAAASVLILIPYPQLAAIATGDTTESLYSFLVYLSLIAGYRALKELRGRDIFWAGACLGVTYMARPEGLMVFEVFAALVAWRVLRPAADAAGLKAAAAKICLMVAGFALAALPYAAFLTESYGRVVLSPKLPYESIVMKAKVYGDPLKMRDVEGIAPSGRLMWQEKGGAGVVMGYLREDPGKFVRTYLENLASELPWRVMNSSFLVGYPVVYPLYFWLPAIVGFGVLMARPDTRWKAFLVWAPFVNLFLFPVFTKGFWIYHVPYVPGLVILAAGGCLYLSRRLKELAGVYVPLLLALTVFWAGYSAYVKMNSRPESSALISYRTLVSDESMKAGEGARRMLGDEAVYIMQWSRLVYYLGGRWVSMPAAPPFQTVEYARANGADYLVEELIGDRVYNGPSYYGMPGLSLAYKYSSRLTPYVVMIWKIEKASHASTGVPLNGGA